ncbi:MAG: lysylphosphatidylglycerol synthase domain-containing protein [Bacteroidia bacterium]|nr:lysylphosphatidylglycerol synthase domain-containing protein [Bacteroidia bacterium]
MLTSRQKNIALNFLKVAIVCFAVYSVAKSTYTFFAEKGGTYLFSNTLCNSKLQLLIIVALMPMNWLAEAQKWRIIAGRSEEISLMKALTGVLAGLATGAATPNRSGEFAGRIMALRETGLKDGIVLTFFSSAVQVMITIAAGIAGLVYFRNHELVTEHSNHFILMIGCCVFVLAVAIIVIRKKELKEKIRVLSALDMGLLSRAMLWSALRYLIYTLQFFILLRVTGNECSATAVFAAIAVNYLVITIIPTFMILEVFVRGSVASGVIGAFCGNGETAAMCALFLWLLNVGVPVAVGVFAVLRLKVNNSL